MGSGQSMETVVNGDWEHKLCWMVRPTPQQHSSQSQIVGKVERKQSGIELDRLDVCKSSTGAPKMDGGSDKPKIFVTMSSEDKQLSPEKEGRLI